jgi:hypothetical protein
VLAHLRQGKAQQLSAFLFGFGVSHGERARVLASAVVPMRANFFARLIRIY